MKTYTPVEREKHLDEIRANNTHVVNGYTVFLIRERCERLKGGEVYRHISIFPPPKFPQIYDEAQNDNYTIQTTSWGALPIAEIEAVIDRYKKAVKTVKWLQKFNWETTDIVEY